MPATESYGAKLDAITLERILSHVFRTNLTNEDVARAADGEGGGV